MATYILHRNIHWFLTQQTSISHYLVCEKNATISFAHSRVENKLGDGMFAAITNSVKRSEQPEPHEICYFANDSVKR